jgi:hypothetical protein
VERKVLSADGTEYSNILLYSHASRRRIDVGTLPRASHETPKRAGACAEQRDKIETNKGMFSGRYG